MSRYTLINVDHVARAARLPRAQGIAYWHIVSLCNNSESHQYKNYTLRKGQFMTTGDRIAQVVREAGEDLLDYRPGVKILKALEKAGLVALHYCRYGSSHRAVTIVTILGVHGAPTNTHKMAKLTQKEHTPAPTAPTPAPTLSKPDLSYLPMGSPLREKYEQEYRAKTAPTQPHRSYRDLNQVEEDFLL